MKKMNKKGFTLVEMLVVIAIIAILVAILIPTVLGATTKAKAATDAANLRSAMAEFEINSLSNNKDITKNSIYTAAGSIGFTAKESKTDATHGKAIVIYVDGTGKMTAGFVEATNNVEKIGTATAKPFYTGLDLDSLAAKAGSGS